MPAEAANGKRPESVLVVVYDAAGRALLLQRADDPAFWQSVTGSLRWDEDRPLDAARRELEEETGLPGRGLTDLQLRYRYPILPRWRPRYAPGMTENIEHAFAVRVAAGAPVRLNPAEHRAWCWLDLDRAAARVASWSNRDALRRVQARRRAPGF